MASGAVVREDIARSQGGLDRQEELETVIGSIYGKVRLLLKASFSIHVRSWDEGVHSPK